LLFLNRKSIAFGSWIIGLSVVLGLAGWRIFELGRGNTFFFDEWNFLLERSSPSLESLLRHHNGHLSPVPVLLYQVLLRLFGAGTYLPFRGLALILHCGIALSAAVMVRRRAGYTASLTAAGVIAFMGAGWQNWLWGFQMGMQLSILSGLVAVVLVTGEKTPIRQWCVIGLLTLSVASSGVGVSVVVGAVVFAWRRHWRLVIKASAIMAVIYVVWSVTYGDSQASSDNIRLIPSFVARSAAAVMAGIGGWDLAIGGVLAGVIALLVVRKSTTSLTSMPEVPVLAVILIVGWLLSALSRGQFNEPGASRYVHVGVSFAVPLIVLVVVGKRRAFSTSIALVLVGLVAIGGSWDIADAAGREFRDRSAIVRAELTAMMHVTDLIEDQYQPDLSRAPQISFGKFEEFARRFDVPVMSPQEIKQAPEFARFEMDRVYLEATVVALGDSPRPVGWDCRISVPNEVIKVDAGHRLWVSGVHSVEVRRMAKQAHSLTPSSPGAPSMMRFGLDLNPRPWVVRFVSAADAQVCRPKT
jgi:hypothetical protein